MNPSLTLMAPTNSEIPGEEEIIRRYARELQRQELIPPDVPPGELDAEMDQYVVPMHKWLDESPLHSHLMAEGPEHLEAHVWELLRRYVV